MSAMQDRAETARRIEALVEHWFFEAFHGSPVARSTEIWNHVHDAKEELRRRLVAFLAEDARND